MTALAAPPGASESSSSWITWLHVSFMASPNEIVSVYTPQQWKEMQDSVEGGQGGNIYNYTAPVSVSAPDYQAYKKSRREISRDVVYALSNAARR